MILLLAAKKGGVGESTLAVNLAAEAAVSGRSVVLVDTDPSIDTTTIWAQDRQEGGLTPDVHAVRRRGDILHHELQRLDDVHDLVVVDIAGKDSEELRLGLVVADLVLIPIEPSQAVLDQTEALVNTIIKARKLKPDLRALAVLNRVRTHVFDRSASEARKVLDQFPEMSLAGVKIHERNAFRVLGRRPGRERNERQQGTSRNPATGKRGIPMVTARPRRTPADTDVKTFAAEAEKPQERAPEVPSWKRRNKEPKVAGVSLRTSASQQEMLRRAAEIEDMSQQKIVAMTELFMSRSNEPCRYRTRQTKHVRAVLVPAGPNRYKPNRYSPCRYGLYRHLAAMTGPLHDDR
ncbi:ParA family protein [Arthrobacter sp. Z1-9]